MCYGRRDSLGSEGVLLLDECVTGVRTHWAVKRYSCRMIVLRECGTNWAVEGYCCRASMLGVVRDALGSEGVLLSDECITGVRNELGSEGVFLQEECVTGGWTHWTVKGYSCRMEVLRE